MRKGGRPSVAQRFFFTGMQENFFDHPGEFLFFLEKLSFILYRTAAELFKCFLISLTPSLKGSPRPNIILVPVCCQKNCSDFDLLFLMLHFFLQDRNRLRNEFIGLKLTEVLASFRRRDGPNAKPRSARDEADTDLQVQLDVFDEQRESDETHVSVENSDEMRSLFSYCQLLKDIKNRQCPSLSNAVKTFGTYCSSAS